MHDLCSQINAELAQLETNNHTGAGCVTLPGSFGQLRVHLASVDRLACELQLLTLDSPSLATASAHVLDVIGQRLAEKLNYLEEPLRVVEIDTMALDVQLRSAAPRETEHEKCYFEVHVNREGIGLCRYVQRAQQSRERTAAVLTRDTIGRICADLVGSLPGPS